MSSEHGGSGSATPGVEAAGKANEAAGEASDEITRLRDAILECDHRLIQVLARRRDLVIRIGNSKKRMGLPVTDPQREAAVVRRAAVLARDSELDEELVRDLIWRVIASARTQQLESDEPSE